MAISVDKVYKTVLTILNREQRGQLSPAQFNKLARQSQLEILEKTFYDYNRSLSKSNVVGSNDDYGNISENLKEKIDFFAKEQEVHIPAGVNAIKPKIDVRPGRAGAGVPVNVTAGTYSNLATTSNGSGTGLTVTVLATTNNFVSILIVNGGKNYSVGEIITIPQASMTGASANYTFPILSTDINVHGVSLEPSDLYRILNVSRANRLINVEKVNKSEFTYVNSSKLTSPTDQFPIYYRDERGLIVSPSSLGEGYITVDYIRKPLEPAWNASAQAGPNGSITFDSNTSVNFDLHPSEETNVIIRILSFVGIIIKDPFVIQSITKKEQEIFNKENI